MRLVLPALLVMLAALCGCGDRPVTATSPCEQTACTGTDCGSPSPSLSEVCEISALEPGPTPPLQ